MGYSIAGGEAGRRLGGLGDPPLAQSHSVGFQVPGLDEVRTGFRNEETARVTSSSLSHLRPLPDAMAAQGPSQEAGGVGTVAGSACVRRESKIRSSAKRSSSARASRSTTELWRSLSGKLATDGEKQVVLTSNDTKFREKLDRVQSTLSNLGEDEAFLSIDEFGPFAIRLRAGRALVAPDQRHIVPQWLPAESSPRRKEDLGMRTGSKRVRRGQQLQRSSVLTGGCRVSLLNSRDRGAESGRLMQHCLADGRSSFDP